MMTSANFSTWYIFYGEGTAGCSRNNQGPVKTIRDVTWSTLTLLIGHMQLLQFIQAGQANRSIHSGGGGVVLNHFFEQLGENVIE